MRARWIAWRMRRAGWGWIGGHWEWRGEGECPCGWSGRHLHTYAGGLDLAGLQ